ncbi:SAM-dependent methyltransferase [Streptodolium elevatio]
MSGIPHRLRWAVEQLDVQPKDRVLEIGGGRGVAAALVCELLTDGRLVGLDRSESAVKGATARNAGYVADGRARFVLGTLEGADLASEGPFDKVFAVNVNLFWTRDPAHELDLIRGALAPEGTLRLFYEPPPAGQLGSLGARVAATLAANGYAAETTTDPTETVLCVAARTAA